MPHTPATHLTITPEHVYINGEPINVAKDTLELSNPSPVEVQTVTLTIHPTTVTILNENGEATTLYERPETPTHVWLTPIRNSEARDDLPAKDNQAGNTDNAPEECSGLSEIWEKYRKTQKRTLTTEKQHEWMNQFNNKH